jgi:hypothetical protein
MPKGESFMITHDLDREQSLKLSPPNYSAGVIFKKRIRIRRDLCTWPETQEFRVQGKSKDNVTKIEESYKAKGLLLTLPVQVVEVDPQNKNRFCGVSGTHRNKAQDNLGWDYAIYDVVEFETPRARLVFGGTSNHHNPADPLTKHDIHKLISTAIQTKAIADDDVSVKDFIDEVAADRSAQTKRSLFKSYRQTHSKFENLEAFGGVEANKKAEELSLPYLGDVNFEQTGEYGYIKEPGGYKTVMHSGLKLWLDVDEDILLTGYITNPDPTTLSKRREHDKKDVDNLNNFLYEVAAKMTNMDLDEVKKLGKAPFKYNGFLPQVISADPDKGGLPVETNVVDADGTPFKK